MTIENALIVMGGPSRTDQYFARRGIAWVVEALGTAATGFTFSVVIVPLTARWRPEFERSRGSGPGIGERDLG
jgi:hypothetical protein